MRTRQTLLFAGAIFSVGLCAMARGDAASVVGGSDLLVGSGLTQVESWLVNDPSLSYNGSLQFTNIFDKAALDTASTFHGAVDGKGPTVVLMEVRPSSTTTPYQIIGGFNPQSWSSVGTYNLTPTVGDRTAFIFNLSTLDRRDQNVTATGIYQTFNGGGYGPTFGGGHDMHVYSLLNYGYLYSYTYCTTPASACSGWEGWLNLLGGSSTPIDVDRMEVFTIAETSTVPLPAALPLLASGVGAMGLLGWLRRRRTAPSPA